MKKTKILGILIFLLIIILIIVLLYIASLTVLNTNTLENSVNNIDNSINIEKKENVLNNNNVIQNENNSTNNTNDVFYSQEEMGNAKYTKDQLNNFSIKINGINGEIKKYINDIDEFNFQIKEYVYKQGLVDATEMDVQKYEYQESTGRLGILFKLNNPNGNRLRVIINSNGNIDISDYN